MRKWGGLRVPKKVTRHTTADHSRHDTPDQRSSQCYPVLTILILAGIFLFLNTLALDKSHSRSIFLSSFLFSSLSADAQVLAPSSLPPPPPPPPSSPLGPIKPLPVLPGSPVAPPQPFIALSNTTIVGPAYAPPPLVGAPDEEGRVRVLSPGVLPYACSTWAYTRIQSKLRSIRNGETDKPHQAGANDINDVLENIKSSLQGATHITELGVREAVSSWQFAAVAAEAVDQGHRITYRALDITKRDGVEDLEAALWQCPGIYFEYTEGSDLLTPPWHTEVMLLDTWHTYKQLAMELPRWAPFISRALLLHDTSLFGEKDEDSGGHGGKEVNEALFVGLPPKTGLWPAVEEFLGTQEGLKWTIALRHTSGNGLTILLRNSSA